MCFLPEYDRLKKQESYVSVRNELRSKRMCDMQTNYENGILTLIPPEHVDAVNASAFQTEVMEQLEKCQPDAVVLDCDRVNYMSSAGLRVVLRVKQKVDRTSLINVRPDLYDILDVTGFTEMMEVQKVYRMISLQDCEIIGQGANGKVYRLDRENIIKVYLKDALPAIQRERELARAAFVLGVPSAIPYDVVQIKEGGYGTVYELLNAKTFIQVFKDGEKSMDELAEMSTSLLKLIHSRIVKQSFVPSIRDTALKWTETAKAGLPEEVYERLYAMIEAVPDDRHMIHGDYHYRNIMYQDGETLLIDMDKLSHGHPVFELAAMYNAYCGFGTVDPAAGEQFLGIPNETAAILWRGQLERYLETKSEQAVREVEEKAAVIGHIRLLQHYIRRNGLDTEEGRRKIAVSRTVLEELLSHVNTLEF